MSKEACWVVDCGELDYLSSLELQKKISTLRQRDVIPDVLLLIEHPAVIIMGSGAREPMLRIPRRVLEQRGIPVYDININGGVSLHAPGQIVAYAIRKIESGKLDAHINALEETMMSILRDYKIDARKSYIVDEEKHKRLPGVWIIKDGKESNLGSIGVDFKNSITLHGFSLNVNNSLEYFDFINTGKKSSISMKRILNRPLHMPDVKARLAVTYGEIFNYSVEKKMFMSFIDAINKSSRIPEQKDESNIRY